MNDNLIYNFHSSYDSVTLNCVDRVLKIKSLKRSREYFCIDFLGDIGIINFLRRGYLKSGNFNEIFDTFQNSRLEPKSHRYESLFALLIISAVSTVIGGVILDIYQKGKNSRIFDLVDKGIITKLNDLKDKQRLNKFCNMEPTDILRDMIQLKNCYISRLMLDSKEITGKEYFQLVNLFQNNQNEIDRSLIEKHSDFKNGYNQSADKIDENYILLAIKSYGKGSIIKYLESENIEIPYDSNIKNANIINGLPAAPGFFKGTSYLFDKSKHLVLYDKLEQIICIDSKNFTPEIIDVITNFGGVVTWNSGLTGHLPVVCRGMGKPCVIINKDDINKLKDNDDMMLSGSQGIVFTGLYVR